MYTYSVLQDSKAHDLAITWHQRQNDRRKIVFVVRQPKYHFFSFAASGVGVWEHEEKPQFITTAPTPVKIPDATNAVWRVWASDCDFGATIVFPPQIVLDNCVLLLFLTCV